MIFLLIHLCHSDPLLTGNVRFIPEPSSTNCKFHLTYKHFFCVASALIPSDNLPYMYFYTIW